MHNRQILSIYIFIIILFISCQNQHSINSKQNRVLIEEEYNPVLKIMTWKNGKKAAFTLAFDDARSSHYQIAWPLMKKRGIVGTFNINTPVDLNWEPWIELFSNGNEISSHTVSHPDLTSLSSAQVEWELSESYRMIWQNTLTEPVSFANPFGLSSPEVENLISKYYLSARSSGGINKAFLTEKDFYQLKGIGVYPPITNSDLQNWLNNAILDQGYIIVVFHSLTSADSMPNQTYMPISLFEQHLDDMISKSDDFWIATQGEIVKYIRLRQNSLLYFSQTESQIICNLESPVDERIVDVPLTISVLWPQNWIGKSILIYSEKNSYSKIYSKVDSVSLVDLYVNKQYYFVATE